MPFTTDIKSTDLFNNFQSGDLLYGLNEVRNVYLNALREKTGQQHVTVDSYNNKVIIANLDSLTEDYIDNPLQTLSSDEQDYKHYLLSHSKYAPTRLDPKNNNENIKIRRACKAAIFWRSINDKKRIHFCLDKLSVVRIVSKWNCKTGKIDDAFTASELRCIYKNWDKLSDKVIFYDEGRVVQAPWEINEEYWKSGYKQRSAYSNPLDSTKIEQPGKSKKGLVPDRLFFKAGNGNPIGSEAPKFKRSLFKSILVEFNSAPEQEQTVSNIKTNNKAIKSLCTDTTLANSNCSDNTADRKRKLNPTGELFNAIEESDINPMSTQAVATEVNKIAKLGP